MKPVKSCNSNGYLQALDHFTKSKRHPNISLSCEESARSQTSEIRQKNDEGEQLNKLKPCASYSGWTLIWPPEILGTLEGHRNQCAPNSPIVYNDDNGGGDDDDDGIVYNNNNKR